MKPPATPPRPLPPPVREKFDFWALIPASLIVFALAAAVLSAVPLGVEKLKHGAMQPPPDCAWTAALYCNDVPGQECQWGRRWKCAANPPWPETVILRPHGEGATNEQLIRERYP
jgi:hypothetical protein